MIQKIILKNKLVAQTETSVKFSEADSLGIVWHGHYIRYFEDGREAFGQKFELSYLTMFDNGFVAPIVNVHCDYKKPLRYGNRVKILTEYIPCDAAKIQFNYLLFDADTEELVATGNTMQVFLDRSGFILQLSNPAFYEDWKKKHGVIQYKI